MSSSDPDAPPIRADGLQLEDDRPFQEAFWTVERGAWVCFALLVLLSLAGLTGGGGPLSYGTVATEGGSIEYPQVARWKTPDDLTVQFGAGAAERSLTLSPGFSDSFQIEAIQPQPERSTVTNGGHRLTFRFSADAAGRVEIHLRPSGPGIAAFQATLDDGAPVELFTVVLP